MEQYDIEIIEADSGEKAIEQVGISKPDLVIMDIRMPGMGGVKATEILRENYNKNELVIIALSASTLKEEIDETNHLFNNYLIKPINKNTLISELVLYLNHEINTDSIIEDDSNNEIKIQLDTDQLDKVLGYMTELNRLLDTMIVDEIETHLGKFKSYLEENKINEIEKVIIRMITMNQDFDLDQLRCEFNKLNRELKEIQDTNLV